jgi:hypothetical protein
MSTNTIKATRQHYAPLGFPAIIETLEREKVRRLACRKATLAFGAKAAAMEEEAAKINMVGVFIIPGF